ncbi:Arm DNA-binding domain-containing protein [Pedobacter sp. MR2016-19]|uniref:Arm DNA-binding domain-containing protein n=1 Tax=Pedobacter sp. MR2016-19 TaxID=2780089 RepID=UPI001D0B6F19|nr:Arm DNA-binding domain-containing protein [Pedobacter sp. MR2016-19]
MKTNFSLLFYLKKPKNYLKSAVPVYLRITVDGKPVEMSASRKCEPELWNTKAGHMTGTKEDAKTLNSYLDKMKAGVTAAHTALCVEDADTNPIMPTSLETEHLKFDFVLIRIAEANYKLFLRSNNPEVKMLGILANFGKEDSYQAVKSIIDGIQSITKGDFAESRYFKPVYGVPKYATN